MLPRHIHTGGIWNGVTPRDAAALRRVGAILRHFGSRRFLRSSGWVPHAPLVDVVASSSNRSLFASAWPLGTGETVWTVVNRGAADATGPLVAVAAADTRQYWDCYHGVRLHVTAGAVAVPVEARGYVGSESASHHARPPGAAHLVARGKPAVVTPFFECPSCPDRPLSGAV